jgi:long-chain acyl-CoA synthetase
VYLAWRGQRLLPIRPEVVLDLIPVDHVANATIVVAAMTLARAADGVYQLCSGDQNPLRIGDSVTWTRAAVRAERARRGERRLGDRFGPRPVQEATYERWSAPAWARACSGAAGALERLGKPFAGAAAALRRRESQAKLADAVLRTYLPFTSRTSTVFRADRTRALYAGLHPGDRAALPFAPEAIDWPRYWTEVEMEGLFRFALPELGEELRPLRRDLCGDRPGDLWRAAADAHAGKIALVLERGGGRAERIAYADLRERVAGGRDAPDWPLRALAALDRDAAADGAALVSRLVALSERLSITSKDVSLLWRPESNGLQLWACLLLPLCHGAQVILPEQPPGALAEALLRPGVTLLAASVADLRALRGSSRRRPAEGGRPPLLVTAEGDAFPELRGAAASRGARWVDAAAAMLLGAPTGGTP